jgi:hypothetical protein
VLISEVRDALDGMGYKDANPQRSGGWSEVLVEVKKLSENLDETAKLLQSALRDRFNGTGLDIRRVEAVGPRVRKGLRTRAIWALLLAFVGTLICPESDMLPTDEEGNKACNTELITCCPGFNITIAALVLWGAREALVRRAG